MEFVFYGSDFGHKKGEFCKRMKLEYHFISFFRTDFVYEKDGQLLSGSAGDMLIMPKGEIVHHGPREDAEEGFRNDWMYVQGDDFYALIKQYGLPVFEPFSTGGRNALGRAIEKIHRELSFADKGYAELCEIYMREAVIEIARAYASKVPRTARERLSELRGEMARDPKKNWTLRKMADFCGYSESRFSALFKDIYNVSPIAELISLRIENAKRLLIFSRMTVSEIADVVGFSSVYYFSKYFRKATGVTPSEYKRQTK